jgi:hypothetical protein
LNDDERIAGEYLHRLGMGTVAYEPDGQVPPDFLIDGRIAVEVRRLNQTNTIVRAASLEDLRKIRYLSNRVFPTFCSKQRHRTRHEVSL